MSRIILKHVSELPYIDQDETRCLFSLAGVFFFSFTLKSVYLRLIDTFIKKIVTDRLTETPVPRSCEPEVLKLQIILLVEAMPIKFGIDISAKDKNYSKVYANINLNTEFPSDLTTY